MPNQYRECMLILQQREERSVETNNFISNGIGESRRNPRRKVFLGFHRDEGASADKDI